MNFKKGIAYVFMATGVGFIINLISNFLFPKFLSIETYADIKLYQLYITYIGILHFGFSDGMYLRLGGKKIEDVNIDELVSEFKTFKLFQIVVNIFGIIISIFINDKILFLVALSILPVNTINYLRNLYQATGLYDLYSKFTIINNIMTFILNVTLLIGFKIDNPIIYILGQIMVYIFNWILIEKIIKVKIFRKQKGKIEIKYLIYDIKDGILLMLGNFCTVIFTSIDRLFVKYLLGNIYFAYYSFAVSVEGLLNVFITPVVITMYNYLCINNIPEKILKIKRILLIIVPIILASAFPVKWIIERFIIKYCETNNIIFILFAAQFFSIIVRCIYNNLYKAEKRQNRYFFIMVIVIILATVLDIISYGIFKNNEGFAFATLATSIIWFIIGEIDFKNSRYTAREYIFIAIILVTYLVTGLFIKNVIIGCGIYLAITVILILLMFKNEYQYLLKEVFKMLDKNKRLRNI